MSLFPGAPLLYSINILCISAFRIAHTPQELSVFSASLAQCIPALRALLHILCTLGRILYLLSQALKHLLIHPAVIQCPVCTMNVNPIVIGQICERMMLHLRQIQPCYLQRIDVIIPDQFPETLLRALLHELHIKAMDVMPNQHRIPDKFKKISQNFIKERAVCRHIIRDSVNLACMNSS